MLGRLASAEFMIDQACDVREALRGARFYAASKSGVSPADMHFPPPSHFLVDCLHTFQHVDTPFVAVSVRPVELNARALEQFTSIPWDLFSTGSSKELAPVELSSLPALNLLCCNLPACILQMISASLATMVKSGKIHTILLSYTPNKRIGYGRFRGYRRREYHVESHDTVDLRRAERWKAKLEAAFQIPVSRNHFRSAVHSGAQDHFYSILSSNSQRRTCIPKSLVFSHQDTRCTPFIYPKFKAKNLVSQHLILRTAQRETRCLDVDQMKLPFSSVRRICLAAKTISTTKGNFERIILIRAFRLKARSVAACASTSSH
ncbi:hypothetical protein R3P38DRAFT_2760279 [Favolaschia claudopus]|uniref:Uncharacterized protein n=1 Tax=Favolaschia claudopus TaxID=2862362 RepID=A0AAW0E081_9AGAR